MTSVIHIKRSKTLPVRRTGCNCFKKECCGKTWKDEKQFTELFELMSEPTFLKNSANEIAKPPDNEIALNSSKIVREWMCFL